MEACEAGSGAQPGPLSSSCNTPSAPLPTPKSARVPPEVHAYGQPQPPSKHVCGREEYATLDPPIYGWSPRCHISLAIRDVGPSLLHCGPECASYTRYRPPGATTSTGG
jgi:hypothetical protein